jgi:hypothetical protein
MLGASKINPFLFFPRQTPLNMAKSGNCKRLDGG